MRGLLTLRNTNSLEAFSNAVGVRKGCEMFHVGRTTIQKIHELDLNDFILAQLLPDMGTQLPKLHPEWLPAGTVEDGRAQMSVHSWLVRHEGMVILIDAGAGNDKSRPQQMVLDHLKNPFLERLAEANVTPEMVDYVLHTHIHSDHVGWNTRLVEGQWQPTFPNAITICSRLEWQYALALADVDAQGIKSARKKDKLGKPIRVPVSGTFDDSMRPLIQTGRLRLIEPTGEDVLPGLCFLSTPGHSIDHAAIELTVDGQKAIFGGDVMHHPLELYKPELGSAFCEFPAAAKRSRRSLLHRSAESGALYLSSHFPLSSAGRVSIHRGTFGWTFAEGVAS